MRPHKIFSVIFISFLLVGLAKVALAFNPAIDCNTPLLDISNPNKVNETTIQTYLTAYTTKGKWNNDEKYYALCFVKDKSFSGKITKSITISTTATDESGKSIPLIVYGLNLAPSSMTAQTLLTLSGSTPSTPLGAGITLDHVTLTGTGSGTGIVATGTGHSILTSTIQKFDTGVQIGDANNGGADITVKDSNLGTAANVVTTGINLINATDLKIEGLTFNIKIGGHNIMPAYTFDIVAKRCETTIKSANGKSDICDTTKEDNKVVKMAGKPPLEVADCNTSGAVEIYKILIDKTKELVMSCNFSHDVEAKILIGQDEYEIKKGDCAFSCDIPQEKTVKLDDKVSLKYKPNAASNAFDGLVQLAEDGIYTNTLSINWPDYILGGIVMGPTTSGMDTTYTGGPAAFDPTSDPKAQTGGVNNSGSGDGNEQVSQGNGSTGCGANISASAPSATSGMIQLLLAFGAVPIIRYLRWK